MEFIPRFEFYEEVIVRTDALERLQFNGRTGIVLGRAATDDGGSWYYTVSLADDGRGYCFFEAELSPTGRRYSREDFYSGASVQVRVDGAGRGSIVSDKNGEITG